MRWSGYTARCVARYHIPSLCSVSMISPPKTCKSSQRVAVSPRDGAHVVRLCRDLTSPSLDLRLLICHSCDTLAWTSHTGSPVWCYSCPRSAALLCNISGTDMSDLVGWRPPLVSPLCRPITGSTANYCSDRSSLFLCSLGSPRRRCCRRLLHPLR